MKNVFLLFLISITSNCFSQINSFFVAPSETDLAYVAAQDSHYVVRNTSTQINKLFLFIGGTGSNTQSYQTISNYAGNLGYDVINLAYPNSVAAASLGNSSDSMVFNKYRQEVCYGTPLSPDVAVDSLNSIYTRAVKLLNYLNTNYPTQNWGQYLVNPTTLNWSKIAVGGHSQGGGHACYFAKQHDVERVLMFSSPNDYSNFFSNPANWLKTLGATSIHKHFAYLNLLDEVMPFDKQLKNLEGLELFPLYDTTLVDNASAPYNNSRCLYTKQTPGISVLYHNATMKFSAINNAVWNYMLTSTPIAHVSKIEQIPYSIFPNPTTSTLHIQTNGTFQDKAYVIQNLFGQTFLTGKIDNSSELTIDLSSFENGIYFVIIDKTTFKIIKQ